ncbi:MAG: hypothetical protein IJ761_07410 [Bacteroidales bacterium]|nr:hypothetical protein [Bacteroidales bacterium]
MSEDEKYFVTVPNRKAMEKIELLSKDLNNKIKVERGIVIMTDGSCSTSIAKGSECSISTSQWQPVFDEVRALGKKPAYIIHTHPTEGVIDNRVPAKESCEEPSDIDLNTSFYRDNVGAIISWKNVFNKPPEGYSNQIADYRPRIGFYRRTSCKNIYYTSIIDFKNFVDKINR